MTDSAETLHHPRRTDKASVPEGATILDLTDVLPTKVVDEDRHRGQAVERGVWSPVIVEAQPTGEGAAAFAVGAIEPRIGHSSSRVLLNRSTLPLVWGR
jgi:hypothetical protein